MGDEKKSYYVYLPSTQQAQVWDADKFNRNSEALYNDHPDVVVRETSTPLGQQDEVDPNGYYQVQLGGQTQMWDGAKLQRNREALYRDHPDVSVMNTIDYGEARRQAQNEYWTTKQNEARQSIQDFDAQNGEFLREFKFNREMAGRLEGENVLSSPHHVFVAQNQARYDQLQEEREGLRKQYYTNPITLESYRKGAEEAARLKDAYDYQASQAATGSERRDWQRAAKLQDDIRKIYEAPGRYDLESADNGFKEYLKQYGQGAIDTFSDKDFYTFGVTKISRNFDLRGIAKKIENAGENITAEDIDRILTPSEKAEIISFYTLSEAERERAMDELGDTVGEISTAYRAGGTSAESVKFMAEFLISQGLANAAGKAMAGSSNAVAQWLGRQLMSENAINKAIQAGMDIAGPATKAGKALEMAVTKPLIQGLWHTATQLSSLEGISEGLMQTDSNGDLVSVGHAVGEKLLDSVVENWSESFGGAIEEGMALPFKGLGWVGEHTIGNTSFGRWARWMYNAAPTQVLKDAGFNGMIGEMAEEWAGNAVRVGLGLMSKEEFKDFASWQSQAEMAASFAPMSLFGLGTATASAIRRSRELDELSGKVQDIMTRQGRSQAEIDDLFNTRFDTAEDIGKKLAPYLKGISEKALEHGATEQEREDYRTVIDFARALAVDSLGEELDRLYQQDRRDAMSTNISQSVGRFWNEEDVTDNDGNVTGTSRTVRTVTGTDGVTYFVVAAGEDGSVAGVSTEDGRKVTLRADQIQEGTDTTVSMDQYLDDRIAQLDAEEEAARMGEEYRSQVNAVADAVRANPVIPVGTPEAPVNATVVGQEADGVVVTYNDGQSDVTRKMSWSEAGAALGMPIEVKTDDELEQDAAAAYDQARARLSSYRRIIPGTEMAVAIPTADGEEIVNYKFQKAVMDDGQIIFYGQEENGEPVIFTEEMVTNIPDMMASSQNAAEAVEAPVEPAATPAVDKYTDETGKVSQNAFLAQEPEEWAKWNDQRNQDGGADTMETLTAAVTSLDAQLQELANRRQAESRPDEKEAIKQEMSQLQQRRDRLADIMAGYQAPVEDAQPVAAPQQEAAQPAEQTVAEQAPAAPVSYRQSVINSAQERIGEINARMRSGVRSSRRAELMKSRATAIKSLLNRLGMKNAIVTTRAEIMDEYRRRGATEDNLLKLQRTLVLTATTGQRMRGFFSRGYVYILADDIASAMDAVTAFSHEDKHMQNARTGAPAASLDTGVTADEMKTALVSLTRSHMYDNAGEEELADEVIANAAEIAEKDGVGAIPEKLRDAGIKNEEFITFVTKEIINGGQQVYRHLSEAGGDALLDERDGGRSGQDERNSVTAGGGLDRQGSGSDGEGGEGTGDTEVGLGIESLPEDLQAELREKGLTMDGGIVLADHLAEQKQATGYKTPNELDAEGDPILGDTRFSITTMDDWKKNYRKYPDAEERVVRSLENFTERIAADELVYGVVPQGTYKYGEKSSGSFAGPLRTNIEYVVTFDMDTSCPRSLQYLEYVKQIEAKIGRPLTQVESIQLNEMMRMYGQMFPCVYCYCENKRQALKQYYNDFMKARSGVISAKSEAEALKHMYGHSTKAEARNSTDPEVVLNPAAYKVFLEWRKEKSYNPSMKQLWAQYKNDRDVILSALDGMRERGEIGTMMKDDSIVEAVCEDLKIADKTAQKAVGDIVSEWKWDVIENRNHEGHTPVVDEDDMVVDPRTLSLWKEMTAYGKSASQAKNTLRYVPYTDELKTLSQEQKDYINGMGGLRMHSSNDFRIDYVLDYFQFMADMAVTGMMGHTYTKSPEFVRIFGNSGYKINMSIAAYEDADGNIRPNPDEGFDWETARQLRQDFPNAGVMLMATSDNQIQFALDNDWVDMFIPFHASSLPKAVWYDMRKWTDYTTVQNERFLNGTEMREALEADGVSVPKNAKAPDVEKMYNEHFGITIEKGKSGKRIKPHFLPGPTVVDGVQIPGHGNNLQRYLELCRQYGVRPRFYGVKVKDNTPEGGGREVDITEHPNYMKCIKETARTDSPQTPIQFNYDQPSEALGGKTPMEYAFDELQTRAMTESEQAGGPVRNIYESYKQDPYGIVPQFIDNIIKHKQDTGKDYPLDYVTPDSRKWFLTERRALEEAYKDVDTIPYHPHEYDADGNLVMEDNSSDIRASVVSDEEYMDAVNRGDMDAAQEMVDRAAEAAGYTIHAFHGTARADRVGNVFRPDRATSGPMAFFTDDRALAEGYARGKQDTSVAYDSDYDSYKTQFRTRDPKTGKDYSVYDIWHLIPFSERRKIEEKAKHIRGNWEEQGEVIYDPDATEANGAWSYQVSDNRGNILKALNTQWLESGNLYNREKDYLKVLELAGVNEALEKMGFELPRYMDPEYREEAVYDVYLKISNPFDVASMVNDDFISGFEDFAEEHEAEYRNETASADSWDKNDITAEEFADNMRWDMENGNSFAWTQIPDVVTAYLKELGHDGIKDQSGKHGGEVHTVWIPFSSEQVKRTDPVTRDNEGNVIPLSQRFNPANDDIRYSVRGDEIPTTPDVLDLLETRETREARRAEEERRANMNEAEKEEDQVRYSVVTDQALIDQLESEPKRTYYRAAQMIDGQLYPPMAAMVEGEMVAPIQMDAWEQSDERPDLAIPEVYTKGTKKGQQKTYKDGTPKFVFNLDKGKRDTRGKKSSVKAAYNPYIHSSTSPLNDQFASAWARPNLVIMTVEVPESEATSGYRAEKAKDSVGELPWKSGPVSNALKAAGKPERKVFLSRYDKPTGFLENDKAADEIASMLEGVEVAIPFNTVTPGLRDELVKRGIKIGPPEKGNAGDAARPAYEEWLKEQGGKAQEGGLSNAVSELDKNGISINDPALMEQYGLSDVTLSKKGDVVTLNKVVAAQRNHGNGTRFMEDLTAEADRNGWTLALTPDKSFGASSVSRLKNFYKRFGFKDNKGRNTDFTISESMVRVPEGDIRLSVIDITPNVRREMDGIRSRAEKDGTFMKAPNGQPTNLNEDQWLLTRTSNFKNWFGDWENDPENASKVIDENGEPRVVYHGTRWNPLKEAPGKAVFDEERVGQNFDWVDIDWNFFFTASEASARGYGRAVPVFLNIRNMETHTINESVVYEMDEETGHDIVVNAHDAGSENDVVTRVDKPDGVMYTIRAIDTRESERRFHEAISEWEGEHKQELEDRYNELSALCDELAKRIADENRRLYEEVGLDKILNAEYDAIEKHMGYVLDEVVGDMAARKGSDTSTLERLKREFSEADRERFNIFRRVGIEGRPEYGQFEGYENAYDYRAADIFALDDPNQIKSAVANNGEYSRANDDIRFSITAEQDAEYMKAVEDGDMERVQRMVDEAAEKAFPDSKVRGENGRLIKVYHGTGVNFNQFNRPDLAYENGAGSGFYFTDSPEAARLYTMAGFSDNAEKMAEKMQDILISEYGMDQDTAWNIAHEEEESDVFDEVYEKAKDVLFPDPHVVSAYINIERPLDVQNIRGRGADELDRLSEEQGADGIIDKNFSKDYAGIFSRIMKELKPSGDFAQYIVRQPNQIKSADPVTYDDNGNVIPLSQRFNDSNDDIRWSIANQNEETFFSNAERSLDAIKQEKATPEQWLKMIEKNGGLKAGEDKWIGLSDWLKSKEKPVSFDDYWDRTSVKWESVPVENLPQYYAPDRAQFEHDGSFDRAGYQRRENYLWREHLSRREAAINASWQKLKSQGEHHYSPYRSSKSEYIIDRENGIVYRLSDHWGDVGRCSWPVDSETGSKELTIAKAKIADFKRLPLTKQEIADYIRQNKIRIEEVHYAEESEQTYAQAMESYQKEYLALVDEGEAKGEYNAFEYAFEQMILYYGDTFGMAFHRNGNVIEPETDWNDNLSEAARYFLDQRVAVGTPNTINHTRLNYTTDGLDNKREIALTVPTIDPYNEYDDIHFGDAGEGRAIAWARFGEAFTGKNAGMLQGTIEYVGEKAKDSATRKAITGVLMNWNGKERVMRDVKPEDQFRKAKSMFEDALNNNMPSYSEEQQKTARETLAALENLKAEDFAPMKNEGGRVLVIDEIQSKRHQDAREEGGYIDPALDKRLMDATDAYGHFEIQMRVKYGYDENGDMPVGRMTPEEINRWGEVSRELKRARAERDEKQGRIPAAPFEKNWHELAMKRMLRLAAEEDFDYVAWTTGEQQADRYDMRKKIKEIRCQKSDERGGTYYVDFADGLFPASNIMTDKEGKVIYGDGALGDTVGKRLEEVFGKDIAESISNLKTDETVKGNDLAYGGEGMKGFYDDILPRFMNKYGKKWGVKVEDIVLPDIGEDGNGLTMHSVRVTPEMKESVMHGQPMFSIRGDVARDAVERVDADGLSSIIGEEGARDLIRDAYRSLPENVRSGIVDGAMADRLNIDDHTREYLRDLADNGTENDETGLLFSLYDRIRMESGIEDLTDGDIRYMIWREAYGPISGSDMVGLAQDLARKRRWTEVRNVRDNGDIRFSFVKDTDGGGVDMKEIAQRIDERIAGLNKTEQSPRSDSENSADLNSEENYSPATTGAPSIAPKAKVNKKLKDANELAQKLAEFIASGEASSLTIGNYGAKIMKTLSMAEQNQPSKYVNFMSAKGDTITLRIADHSVDARNIILRGIKTDRGVSIVITGSKSGSMRFRPNKWAEVVEYVYDNPDNERLINVTKSLFNLFDEGEYVDLAGADTINKSPRELRYSVVGEKDTRTNANDSRAEASAAVDAASSGLESAKKDLGQLQKIAKAMGAQKQYDKETVKAVADLAKEMMKDAGMNALGRREVGRLMGIIKTSVGKSPRLVKRNADRLVDMVIDHLIKGEQDKLDRIMKKTGKKVNATGVEVQGELDVQGQKMMAAFKKGIAMDLGTVDDSEDMNTLYGRRAALQDQLESEDDAMRREAEAVDAGLALAIDYKETVNEITADIEKLVDYKGQLDNDFSAGKIGSDEYRQNMEAADEAIRDNRITQLEAMRDFVAKISGSLAESIDARKAFTEREKERVEHIHHMANSDLEGVPNDIDNEKPPRGSGWANGVLARFFFAPLATFDQMLRLFGRKSVNGEGYLYSWYMRKWQDATGNAYQGTRDAFNELDRKASSVFGKKMRWSDIYEIERRLPKAEVSWKNAKGEMVKHELTQGQLLYIYMVNKMSDGRMKLRRMGILEQHVAAIARELDPRFIELADWMQDEYLVEKRNKYNEVHERLFGASMAAIENYFPLKINKRSLNKQEDLGTDAGFDPMPSTSTGSIIKRRVNTQPLDILNADAFSVMIEHIEQMEQWAAFAEFNKDINSLISYKNFRNKVQNMATVYGAGTTLWKNFKDVAKIATGSFRPSADATGVDRAAMNIAKGVTGAKISFRIFTALKQFLSMPAFLADANPAYLAKNMATPWEAWNWAMDNLPIFEKRWKSRMAGDTRLMKTDSDWKLFHTKMVEKLSRWGMSPNAFVDALTVSIGARSVYETKKARYIKEGFSEEEADRKAKQDATTVYNQSQQSNESAYVSRVQLDRTFFSSAVTVFRNSAMGFQRQVHSALRGYARMMNPGYREQSIEFTAKQLVREGLSEEQAREAATRRYNHAYWQNAVRIGVFGFLVQFCWNLGSSIAYLLFGDDDDEKKAMIDEAAIHALVGGWNEGLTGGSLISEMLNMVAHGESLRNYDPTLMPLISDIKRTAQMMDYDPVAGANELVNLAVQSGIGVNPQTLTDAVVAVIDACDGDPVLSQEALILTMRVLQVPQSQVDKIYIDELGMSAKRARTLSAAQMAKRYAEYKTMKGAPVTGWAYDEALRKKRDKAYRTKFENAVKARKELKKGNKK